MTNLIPLRNQRRGIWHQGEAANYRLGTESCILSEESNGTHHAETDFCIRLVCPSPRSAILVGNGAYWRPFFDACGFACADGRSRERDGAGSSRRGLDLGPAQVTNAAGVSSGGDLISIIGRIINIFLGLLGVIFLVLLLYAGFLYMTAAGDAEKVQKALTTIRNAVIGLVIIASAWAITSFILGFFTGNEGGLGGIGGTGAPISSGLSGSSGSLGHGEIESVLPEPNSKDNPRNTPIFVTFKHPVYPGSFITGWTDAASTTAKGLNTDNVKIYRVDGGVATALPSDGARVYYTADLKTFVIKPVSYLGSPTVNVGYKVELKGGSTGMKLNAFNKDGTTVADANLKPVFVGAYSAGEIWQFEVSTVLDLTPPNVVATVPPVTGPYDRNIVIQLNFNKAMDPTTVTGKSPEFSNIQILSSDIKNTPNTVVPGEFRISNHYKTVEFVTDSKCGTNSCGMDVFCLPPTASIHLEARAATIDANAPPQGLLKQTGLSLYDGVVSAVGNSLDGNKLGGDGKAEGPPVDDFVFDFTTTDKVRLTPPKITGTVPDANPQSGGGSNIPLDQVMVATFDSLLMSSTLNTDNAYIDAHGKGETNPDTFWYQVGMKLVNDDGSDFNPAAQPPTVPTRAAIEISHRLFLPSGVGAANLNLYDPYIISGVQDAYQNCFMPAADCNGAKGDPNCCMLRPTSRECKEILNP